MKCMGNHTRGALFATALLMLVALAGPVSAESVETAHFEVAFASGGKLYAGLVADIAEKSYGRIAAALGHEPESRIVIYLTGNREEFDRMTRKALPDWSSAVSLSKDRIVLSPLAGRKMGLERILPHEIVHCFINDAAGVTHVPRWFHEGLAETLSGSLGVRARLLLTVRSIRGDLLSFMDIQQIFSADSDVASVAYDQSRLAVDYLAQMHGEDIYAAIIAGLASGKHFDAAFETATGISPGRFETAYLAWIREQYNLRSLISYLPGTWTAIIILAFIAWGATKLRNRRILKKWEKENRPGNVVDFNRYPPDDDYYFDD